MLYAVAFLHTCVQVRFVFLYHFLKIFGVRPLFRFSLVGMISYGVNVKILLFVFYVAMFAQNY